MSRRTLRDIALYTLVVAEALRLAERPGESITRAEIEAEADRWFNRRPEPARKRQNRHLRIYFTRPCRPWLTFLGRFQPSATVQQPYADHVTKFADSLRERGLSAQTVANSSRALHRFLARIEEADLSLETLTVVQVDDLLAKMVGDGGYARTTIQAWASTLRQFFRFAEGRGWCREGLAAAIMAPASLRP